MTNNQIKNWKSKRKKWLIEKEPYCIFCGHFIGSHGQLAHKIRISESKEYECMDLNTGLAHHQCHDIFDNNITDAIEILPLFNDVMMDILLIDEAIFNKIILNLEKNNIPFNL